MARSRRTALLIGAVSAIAGACSPDPPSAAVGIVVEGCGPADDTGSGAIVAPGIVLTSAHVVAGADSITVYRPGWSRPGEIVAFDDEMDLAYLRIDHPPGVELDVTSEHVENGDEGVAYVYRDHEPVVVPVTIERRARIHTEDIYVEGKTVRPGFELDAEIVPGDSGGPVLVDGSVVGIVWARSRRSGDRAWAIDPARAGTLIEEQLADGRIGDDIDITRCP